MITRQDILNVIGDQWGPSEVSEILDGIRRDSVDALTFAAQRVGTHIVRMLGVESVVGERHALVYLVERGRWRVVPRVLVQQHEPAAAIAVVESVPGVSGIELNRVHVAAVGAHRTARQTGGVLADLVQDRVIRPIGKSRERWLFESAVHVACAERWSFDRVA